MAPPLFPIPAPLTEPPVIGLLPTLGRRAAQVNDDREVGFTFNPESCGVSGTLPADPCDSTPPNKTIGANPTTIAAPSFAVWAGDKCSTFDFERDREGRTRRQLRATESYQVAHELWTGDETSALTVPTDAETRHLASIDSDVLTDVPTSPTDALALLEYGLGDCGKGAGGRVIHATQHAATFWAQLGLLRREGSLLLTFLGSVVIADAGYDGSGPYGQTAADGSQWAYATGWPIVRLGPEHLLPDAGDFGAALNRSSNTVEWRIERKAAVSWDGCCHLAVEMNLQWADIGGAGS